MAKSISARDFTVGWVCALPIELAAAAQMMDEEFADLPSRPSDSNIYSFGRIGVHNVVAACLPAGQMGTSQAATVASQMRSSFPSLRFGVLVGIGGGVPNFDDDIDIRLGDVVISQPSGQHGGVIQYDFGKTGADGRIARTGSLNAPPTILLNALAKLRANHILGKTQIRSHLSKPLSQPNFASPGPEKDTLYDASSSHISGSTCAKCWPEDAVDRDTRVTTDPVLFFGNIASGNQVMKDGPTRDRYSQELGGVLCFEMEAAGLMNNFHCIVIRGICDYADAHKNKRWQPYAAATAAASAKELLYTIPPLAMNILDGPEDCRRKRHFIVPFGRNESFVGRDAVLTQLLERIPPSSNKDACQRTAVVGLGGIGKTQVAIEAAYRVRDAHPACSVFWVPAVDMAMFENAYREIGRALNIQGIDDGQMNVRNIVNGVLGQDDVGSWLLIIDNADDVELLFTNSKLTGHLPFSRKGSILLTTRNHQAAARFSRDQAIRLGEMGPIEATRLLYNSLDESQLSDDQTTMQLLKHLTYLPLAIRQASAFMASNRNVTVSKYLEYCESSDDVLVQLLSKDFDDQDRYETMQNPVATTWLISFEHISRSCPLAAKYLRFICYLAEKDIPRALLPPAEDEIDTEEAIGTLVAHAFIMQRDSIDRFDVHRLVRLVMRNWVREQGKQEEEVTETIQRLSRVFPRPEYANQKIWVVYLSHAQAALELEAWCTDDNALYNLLSLMGRFNFLLGKDREEEQMYRQILQLSKKVLGPEHPETLKSMNNLAEALLGQGKYEEAEQMHRQVLQLKEKVLGPEHLVTLSSMNNLAGSLQRQGKYKEAEQIHRQVLQLKEKVLGPEHLVTLSSMNNLAGSLQRQGKYKEAEQIHRQVLQLREKALGPEHPETLLSKSNLATVLHSQQKYEEAEQVFQRTLRLREKVLGPEHPDTLSSKNNLAASLQIQGKYEEAEQIYRQVLQLREKALGPEHPETLLSKSNLATVLHSQQKHEEAEQVFQRTLRLREKVLGPEHPKTLSSMNNLAGSLQIQGKYDEAEQIYRQVLQLREKVLGPEHPKTLSSMNNLAASLQGQGKYDEAEQILQQTLQLHEKVYGPEHLSTLIVKSNLAKTEEQRGRADASADSSAIR